MSVGALASWHVIRSSAKASSGASSLAAGGAHRLVEAARDVGIARAQRWAAALRGAAGRTAARADGIARWVAAVAAPERRRRPGVSSAIARQAVADHVVLGRRLRLMAQRPVERRRGDACRSRRRPAASYVTGAPGAASGGVPRTARMRGSTISEAALPRSGLHAAATASARRATRRLVACRCIRTPPARPAPPASAGR